MKTKAALALSGGGSLGIAHVGVLEILCKEYEFDYVCGVSAGAIVGAGIALGKTPTQIWQIFNDTNLFDITLDISPRNSGLIKGRKIYKLLDEIYEGKSFADLSIPLIIGATDFATGERISIREGKIVDAVRASIGIPLVFEPYLHPDLDRPLVDGFLSQNFPLDIAVDQYKGDHIIGIDVASLPPLPDNFGHEKLWGKNKILFASLQRTLRIMYQNQQRHWPEDPRVQIYRPDLSDFSSMTIGHKNFKKIKDQGRKAI